jgi:hypothetical protein
MKERSRLGMVALACMVEIREKVHKTPSGPMAGQGGAHLSCQLCGEAQLEGL